MRERSWFRLLLWSYVISVASFYLILWRRTRPANNDRVKVLPPQQARAALTSSAPSASSLQRGTTVPGWERATATTPTVSVIVPARNEERTIERCVQSLLEQDLDDYEVIVVDDGSSDGTERILDQLARSHPQGERLWVLKLRDELPEGWAGKPHALHSGVLEARGQWLLFTDADTYHAPNALRSTLTQAQEEDLALLTISTTQDLPTFWDRVLMPIAYMGISMLYPPRLVNDPTSAVAIANGQYILIRREVYDRLGGYARPTLRSTLLDDRDLAVLVKEQGFPLRVLDGRDLVHVHMYRNLAETWRGWRKNAYLGSRGGLGFVFLELIGLPMVTIAPFLLPFVTKLGSRSARQSTSQGETSRAAVVALLPLLAYRAWLNRKLHVPWYYALTHPLGGAIFTGILGQSTWRVLTGKGVDWRGRRYYHRQR